MSMTSFSVKMINNAKSNCIEKRKKLAKYQTRYFAKTFIFIISIWCVYHAVHLVLQLCKSFDPKWPKCSFWAPGHKVKTFFQISWFYWIHLMIFEKMKSCLWKLEPGFWTYGWICLLGPSGPNVVCRPQVPRSRHFFRFYNFIELISWFLRKWSPACENWSQGTELMAGYVFWAQVAKMYFLGPRPQVQDIFWYFVILLDSSHHLKKWGPVCQYWS